MTVAIRWGCEIRKYIERHADRAGFTGAMSGLALR